MTLISAADINMDMLVNVFNEAYSDYMVPLQLNEAAMKHTILQNSIDLNASPVAMADDQAVGMAFLAIRGFRGWVGGMGVIPSQRRKGFGREVMSGLIENAKSRQLDTVQLEVIENNEPAYELYLDLGFEVVRRLMIAHCHIAPEFEDDSITVKRVESSEALDYYEQFHTSPNPWQRELESLRHATELDAWFAWQDDIPIGYTIGKVTDQMIHIADAVSEEEDGLWALIAAMGAEADDDVPLSMVNVGDDDPAWSILNDMGFEESFAQLEMVYKI